MKSDFQQQQASGKQGAIEVVADYADLCGEGPLWDDQKQILYWTDIDGKKSYRYLWNERRHELVQQGFQINGWTMQESGGCLLLTVAIKTMAVDRFRGNQNALLAKNSAAPDPFRLTLTTSPMGEAPNE
jgi:sugar lactone lactonase YvrE